MNNPSGPCLDRAQALHALVDGELDALSARDIELHLRGCRGCSEEFGRIEAVRAALAATGLRHRAPASLRSRIGRLTGAEAGPPSRPLLPWLGGGALGALAASLALFLALPELAEPGLAMALVDGQIRSLQGGHLVDVVSSDHHTVKPWFNGRVAYAPPVVDLATQGFPLIGGRLDVVDHSDVAVLVYRRHLHTINLTIRPAPRFSSPLGATRHLAGYNLRRWTADGLEFWAVSDLEPGDLERFARSFVLAQGKT